jgi:uncharacterized protein YkwD
MMRRSYLALACMLALSAIAATAPAHADALATVQMLRAGGCGGVLPIARPLSHNTLLDQAAAQWAAGTALMSAAERAGYGPQSATGLYLRGTDWAVIEQLRRSGCSTVLDRGLREMGFYQRGPETWLVFAWGYGTRGYGLPNAPPSAGLTRPPAPPPASVAAPAVTAAAGSAVPPEANFRPQQLANRALELVNDVRSRGARCGGHAYGPAPPLVLSGTLGNVAFGHATDMAAHNYFEHEDPGGHSPADRVRAVGYKEKLVGENIAYGPKSVEEVVQGWLDSPGHCQNIMDPRFVEMGIAFANGQSLSRRGLYWVQLLAEPRA